MTIQSILTSLRQFDPRVSGRRNEEQQCRARCEISTSEVCRPEKTNKLTIRIINLEKTMETKNDRIEPLERFEVRYSGEI